jgi:hypothetical protein
VRNPRHLTSVAGATLVALATLAGCGDDPSPTGETQETEAWQDTDPCTLLDAEQVADLIGPDAVADNATDDPERPQCTWSVGESPQELVLRLWQPPIPEALTDHATRTTEVGDRTGWVESEGEGFCNMHVEAEPAWLTVDLNVRFEKFQPKLCNAAVATAETVLDQVG